MTSESGAERGADRQLGLLHIFDSADLLAAFRLHLEDLDLATIRPGTICGPPPADRGRLKSCVGEDPVPDLRDMSRGFRPTRPRFSAVSAWI
ncbi:MAG TPA: hypothetical protein VF920_00185 [Dongiaceae bacterium]